MKKTIFIFFVLLVSASCVIYIPYSEEEPSSVRALDSYPSELDISFFYSYLSDYGIWVYYPPYEYVWVPQVTGYGWRPYTYGHWVWTDCGWTWVSRFEWGWAPFHYGRWGWNAELGWFWVPGTVWAPAWVTWRHSTLYVGWAPLPPGVRFVREVGVTSLPFSLPVTFWVFVEGRYFLDSPVYRYVLPYERNTTLIRLTLIKTNIIVRDRRVINQGIDIGFVRRVTGRSVTRYELKNARSPQPSKVKLRRIEVYRPSLSENQAAKPGRIYKKEEAAERVSRVTLKREAGEIRLKDLQEKEERLLEESQREEIRQISKTYEKKKVVAKSDAEKAKIEKEYMKRVEELKKRHEVEKTSLKKRHEEEKKRVTKKKIKRKK